MSSPTHRNGKFSRYEANHSFYSSFPSQIRSGAFKGELHDAARQFSYHDGPEIQERGNASEHERRRFLQYLAKLMNTSSEQLKETYVASNGKSFEACAEIVRGIIDGKEKVRSYNDNDLEVF